MSFQRSSPRLPLFLAALATSVAACAAPGLQEIVPAPAARGGPAAPVPARATQPDGYEFEVFLRGDERWNWHETGDGYSVVLGPDGAWYYARCEEGRLVASGDRVSSAPPPPGLPRHLRPGCGAASEPAGR